MLCSCVHIMFTKIDYMLSHKTRLSKFQKIKIKEFQTTLELNKPTGKYIEKGTK